MTTYGFAIKALPKGGKPFGEEDDDENEETVGAGGASLEGADLGAPDSDPAAGDLDDLPEASTAGSDPAALEGDPEAPAAEDAAPEEKEGSEPPADLMPADDDARPWSGDLYNEGDETEPDTAYCAYTGIDGEQAWLDRSPDGTLTGWVRDSTGQVWRFTDPDAWAVDVDGAQMTRTHGPEEEADPAAPAAPGEPAQPGDRGVQDQMFANQ
ncbi:hypothetical protein ACFC51_32925 [Streptomyces sp. NPDC055962]|uniref:hypothetical protein n=1 Tax=Streptomyces sp. NPDC055962 TaxID=3345667 RepID=UPI0035D980FB